VRVSVEPYELGEHHRDVVVLLGDGLFALLVALGHRLRHQGVHELLVLRRLDVDQLLLDPQAGGHVVEGRAQIADLVPRAVRHLDGEITAGDPAHRRHQAVDGSGEHLGEQQRQQTDDEHDAE
jgi:hypothetical protein